ncbi:mannitol dehydrogenase family protein [Oceaniglobus trochenteri]|uniref:mannitol dehydrogenase family protein n=1 Tax=Oceaniglobus trochenteri TaxID=2763260 RepID=UPI001CFF9784|nr:mannitol dehydrogenase family protein [Oceaniglobus trochenteri]
MTHDQPKQAVTCPIVQFGTSRFLQAHADLMVDEARQSGQDCGPIAVVQSSGDPARAARLAALAAPGGYPVHIRGLEKGQVVDRTQQVRSVRRTLSTATDWDTLVRVVSQEARYILSNTGDRGFDAQPADSVASFDQAMSYPAKLQLLLRARFDAKGGPVTIMPMELVVRNGDVLKARVLELAGGDAAYRGWLANDVIWANSLVDRIVSEPIQPAGAIAEPYALWAIENAPGLIPPCQHPAIQMVDDLDGIAALKLFILNLGHSWLVDRWSQMDGAPATVAGLLDVQSVLDDLRDLYSAEVLPGFDAAGMGPEARDYVEATIERYRNPFLHHQLSDIAQNHAAKITRRIEGFLTWAQSHGDQTEKPRLNATIKRAKQDD